MCRVRNSVLVVDIELILRTCASFCHQFEPAVLEFAHTKLAFRLVEAAGDQRDQHFDS
jgi:hypothetical protein